MLSQLLNATIRILFLRAGPQDFPYVNSLMPALAAAAVAVNGVVFVQVLPASIALGIAAAMVGAMALVTRTVLRARKLDNRFQQTFNALLATTTLLTLAMLPSFIHLAPQVLKLAQHPELLSDPNAVRFAAVPVFVMNLLNLWNFVVTAHIFRHAAGVNLWVGLLIAFIAAGVMLFVGVLGGSLVGALSGAGV